MPSVKEHIKTHSKNVAYHFKKHHKKYLFGVIGGTLAVKLFLTLITSLGLYESLPAFAQEAFDNQEIIQEELIQDTKIFVEENTMGNFEYTGDTLTGDTLTGDTLTGDTLTGDTLTGDTLTGDTLTGDTLTGDTLTGDTLTGDTLTGDTLTGDTLTGDTLTGDTLTGDTLTGDTLTGDTLTGDTLTGGFVADPENTSNLCEVSDFNFINPLSGSKVKGNINISRTYNSTDCTGKNFDIYLWDHNNQRILIGTSSYLNTRYQFDSTKLYSGFYNILSTTGITIYTGEYSGLNSYFYTGYTLKFVDQDNDIVYTGDYFTIDNQLPILSGINLTFTGNYNIGYIGLSGIVNISFNSNEELTGVIVNILGTNSDFISKVGLAYNYSRTLTNQNSGTNVYYNISFQDLAGNTGSVYGTSTVLFDKVIPVLDDLIFSGTNEDILISRSGNELTKTDFIYALTGNQTGELISISDYSQTGNINLTGLDIDEVYNYNVTFTDPVNNKLTIGGSFHFSTGGNVVFIYNTISTSTNSGTMLNFDVSTGSTGNINSMANIIKKEVSKFNECKDGVDITKINIKINDENIGLNMPNFEKSYVRTIVNSFTIVVMDKLQQKTLDTDDLERIIKRFDDFLVILKLIRDDENQCKQNMSNYHIRLFQKALSEYNISIE